MTGSDCSSFRQGIWMISFIARISSQPASIGTRLRKLERPLSRKARRVPRPALLAPRNSTPVESATVERSAPGLPGFARRALALPADTVALWALAALCVLAVVGFFTWVTYPNYDSYYSLLWGDELLHGHLPSFEAYRAPTEHPLGGRVRRRAVACSARTRTA